MSWHFTESLGAIEMRSLYSKGKDTARQGIPFPQNQFVASKMPTLCLSSFGALDHLSRSHIPSLRHTGNRVAMYGSRLLSQSCLIVMLHVSRTTVQADILHSQIEWLTFFFFFSITHTFDHLISLFNLILGQIWGDWQGQIHPCSPQLALNPVIWVSGRGRCFHAGCTIDLVFTLLYICITDCRTWVTSTGSHSHRMLLIFVSTCLY